MTPLFGLSADSVVTLLGFVGTVGSVAWGMYLHFFAKKKDRPSVVIITDPNHPEGVWPPRHIEKPVKTSSRLELLVGCGAVGFMFLFCGGCVSNMFRGCPPDERVPDPPTLSPSPGDGQVTLQWTGVRANKYTVYRGDKSGALKVLKADLTATQFTDGKLTNGTTYYYAVSATNNKGEGPKSAEATATPKVPTPPPPPPPPPPPTLSNGTLRVTWISLDINFDQLELFIDGQLSRAPTTFPTGYDTKSQIDYDLKAGIHKLTLKRSGILLYEKQVDVQPKSQGITPLSAEFHQTGMIEQKSRNSVAPGVVAWVWIDGERKKQ